MRIPEIGLDHQTVIDKLNDAKSEDVAWKDGRSWSLIYYAGDEHTELLKEAYSLYFSENGAGPSMFPSLRRMEAEVVSMVANLLGGDSDAVGTMTSGGTESILLSIKAYRDWARAHKRHITRPEILVPVSAHPAFLKAAHYFGLRVVPVPLNPDYEADLQAIQERISDQTVCLVASAPSLPHGVMDPVVEMADVAESSGIGLHVDACLGGFLLPFMRKNGHDVPPFGFDVPGVTSISADLHKNGYTAKGASAVLYRNSGLRRHQFFVSTDSADGLYASPTMMGTRPGGAIAAAWAALMTLGEDGYTDIAARTMETTRALMAGITAVPELSILGNPLMNVFAFTADKIDIFSLADRVDAMGWRINRKNQPDALHMIATPNHAPVVGDFLSDLDKALAAEREDPHQGGTRRSAMLYGGTENIGAAEDARERAYSRLERLYSL
jgi:glutamate/tyrosine decarboxylase-like PLP-dependent enzyme